MSSHDHTSTSTTLTIDTASIQSQAPSMANADLIENLYRQWKTDSQSVDPTWRAFFEGFELGCQLAPSTEAEASSPPSAPPPPVLDDENHRLKQAYVYKLIFSYRVRGHLKARLDPLELTDPAPSQLELEHFHLSEADLETEFDATTIPGGGRKTLRQILEILETTYCRTIGVEFMHIQDFEIKRWLRDRMESNQNRFEFTKKKKIRILQKLQSAEMFERFLHTRYVGQKRFSLEGGETLIPALDALTEKSPAYGVEQFVLGMAHRGRLNVLANVLEKSYQSIFHEFSENYIPETVQGNGDVKYHLGYESAISNSSGKRVVLSLAPNPSHLEAVNPVVQGKTRARQKRLKDTEKRAKVVPILIHGDSAFSGQGVVAETLNLSQLEGYRTGGTIHIIINNQIGFTTVPKDSRSAPYCTAPAKTFDIPIFHINGDDPLSAVYLIELALEYRQRFKKDVVLDIVCYRRHGHNEGDEPSMTQPTLYAKIKDHPPVSQILIRQLLQTNEITQAEADEYTQAFAKQLDRELTRAKENADRLRPAIRPPLTCPELFGPIDTTVPIGTLRQIGRLITAEPNHIQLNSIVQRILQNRQKMLEEKTPVDWGFAEALCFGTLLVENIPVRLTGQDSRRGTFGHRHACLYDVRTRERYIPLQNLDPNQASFCIYNSPLSEASVLGFDYGYSLNISEALVLWEAQFGDFSNGAQTIIDQYITSSESKWGLTSRIVLLLPHGYHGMGPEHSSARVERFLQACAEDNIQVANCTTPANYFHLLRRQALRKIRKPLILFTPKALLRDKRATSTLNELAEGNFQEIIPDTVSNARRVILCSGKVYYDLLQHREANNTNDTAIIRLEQLYPLHKDKLREAVFVHSKAEKFVWCQEEPKNMGAFGFLEPQLRHLFRQNFAYAGRPASSSPATGSLAIHELEQKAIIQQAFEI